MNAYPKYEYIGRSFNGMTTNAIIEELNKLGDNGWELINVDVNLFTVGINNDLPMFLFKREYHELIISD